MNYRSETYNAFFLVLDNSNKMVILIINSAEFEKIFSFLKKYLSG